MDNWIWFKKTIRNIWKEFKVKAKKRDKLNIEEMAPKGGYCPKCNTKLRVSFDHADKFSFTSLDCDKCGWYTK